MSNNKRKTKNRRYIEARRKAQKPLVSQKGKKASKVLKLKKPSSSIHSHEPLIQMSKRPSIPFLKSTMIRVIAVAIAVVVCSVVIVLLSGYNPLQVFRAMIDGTFGKERKTWYTLQNLSMLLCISLAVTPAFKMKFWNIGAEGQALMGGLATAAVMIYFGNSLPSYALIPFMFVAAVLAGMIWGVIPAIFKAYFGTNETLFTLMMNYVATQLVSFFMVFWENPKGSNKLGIINRQTQGGWLPVIGDQKYMLNIIVVAVLTIAMFIYLKYSKHGYEISVVGESENTARYVGINVKKVIIRTMALSGALCGITGLLLVAGTHHTLDVNTIGGMGFTAIMVSWLAKFNPAVMVLVSFLIAFLEKGAGQIATSCSLDQSIADILTGIILFFIIGSEFFIQYKLTFRKKHKEVA